LRKITEELKEDFSFRFKKTKGYYDGNKVGVVHGGWGRRG